MPSFDVLLFRLLLVIVIGGLIGAEREYRSKSAVFRTLILICLGSFLFTTFSIHISPQTPDRIASNIVTGIGFLGAGVIFQSDNRVNGLTTAAVIWATAALGMGVADGAYAAVFIGTLTVLVSLFFLHKLENVIDRLNQTRVYKIISTYQEDLLLQYEGFLKEHGLKFKRLKQTKIGADITGSWLVEGKEKNHQKFIERILHDTTVKEFEF